MHAGWVTAKPELWTLWTGPWTGPWTGLWTGIIIIID
jgi:hypothetical protein